MSQEEIKELQKRIEALENRHALEPCTINSSSIGINADDDETTQLLECQLLEDNDVQTIEELHIPNFQYNPPLLSRAFFSAAWEELKVLVGINDRIQKYQLSPGEFVLYSSDSGTMKAKIVGLLSGNLQLNGSGNFAVKYNELMIAFNELQTAYNAHNHGGSGTSAVSVADITTTQATTIELG